MSIRPFALLSFLVFLPLASACAERAVGLDDEADQADEADEEQDNPFLPSEQYSDCLDGFDCMSLWCLSPVDEPGFCTASCVDVDDCELSPIGTAEPTCLAIASEAACALDCGDGRTCPPGMRCEQVDAGGERSICF